MKEAKELNPGSNEAVDKGCLCPVLDNCHGKGIFDSPKGNFPSRGIFWINEDCPLHGIKKVVNNDSKNK